jgi:predicted RNA methylase
MKIKTVGIDTDVEVILRAAKLEGNKLTLQGQLTPQMYKKVMKVLELIGFKWNKKEKCHIGEGDSAEKLKEGLGSGEVVNEKKTYQFFETPKEVARKLVELADIGAFDRVLEPSAGKGAIIRAIQEGCPSLGIIYACELNPAMIGDLEVLGEESRKAGRGDVIIEHGDFLEHEGKYNRIVMNPPFSGGQDCLHVRHAYDLLMDNGVVVAIMSKGWHYNSTRKFVEFREWFRELEGRGLARVACELESGSFSESGTEVATDVVVLCK